MKWEGEKERKRETNVFFVEAKNNNIKNFQFRRKSYAFTRYGHCLRPIEHFLLKVHSVKSYLVSNFGGKKYEWKSGHEISKWVDYRGAIHR